MMEWGFKRLSAIAVAMAALMPAAAHAAACGNDGSGFERWKQAFAQEAASAGVKGRGLDALASAKYATATIKVDRAVRKAFSGDVNSFMKRRGGATIISKGKSLKKQHAKLFADLERRYGVPAGPLLAIWGMETGFGGFMGKQNTVSAIVTLAYDCRRPQFFAPHAIAALKLVDAGVINASSVGAAHGEIGHTQFLPGNVLKYGVGSMNLREMSTALASTANFLRAHGYRGGAASANPGAIAGWNSASVYQQAIIIMADAIDGN
ncbi:MAG TPA: lytic transglycosylase domain-containing protein [Rhizobiaceae bacterium]|nr:lytic transglycosylase domain-containing protein [Rhizobiaceae bacterium]